mmetsp:Transcript_100433/g.230589  ORF Transcript_100433/g.230589 Transcript_100433/m.230589 type:complete len:334 (-) Transcript_100433:32-1033(-)
MWTSKKPKKLEADVRTLKQEVQTKQQGLQEIASRVEGEQRRVTSGETAVKELYTTRDSLWQQLEELGVARQDRVMLGALIKYQRLCRSTAVHPKGMPLPREVLLPTRAATPAAAATRAAVPAVPPPEDAHRHASEGAIGAVSDTGFSKASADAGKGSDVDCGTGPDAGSGAGPEVTGVDPGVFDPRSVSASLVLPQSPADRNFEMKPETKIGLDPASVAAVGIPRDANSVIDLIYATDPGAALEKGGLVDELRKSSMVRRAVGLPEPGSPGVQEAEDELFALLAVGSAHVTAEQAKQWLEQSRRGSLANSGGWCSVCQSGGVLSYFQQLMQGR